MIRRVIVQIGSQSWGLLLIFAVWQVWVMASGYNSIVAVTPVAVVRDIVLHPMVYLLPALWTLGFGISGLAAGLTLGLFLAIAAWRSEALSGANCRPTASDNDVTKVIAPAANAVTAPA